MTCHRNGKPGTLALCCCILLIIPSNKIVDHSTEYGFCKGAYNTCTKNYHINANGNPMSAYMFCYKTTGYKCQNNSSGNLQQNTPQDQFSFLALVNNMARI